MQAQHSQPNYTIIIVVFFIAILCLAIGNYSANISQSTITNTRGNLKTVGVQAYSTLNHTLLENIDWGNLTVGETKNLTAYIHNTGNHNATITVTTNNYTPSILMKYSTFSCPLNNTVLYVDQIEETVFTFHIHYFNIPKNMMAFTFDIVVTGTA